MSYTAPKLLGSSRQKTTSRPGRHGPPAGALVQVGQGMPGVGSTPPASPLSPFDAATERTKTNLGAQQTSDLANITYDSTTGANDLGYSLSRDGKGNITGSALDPSNPFSKMALLQKSFQEHQRGNTNSYAAQGQLYSGALQNAQDENRFQYDQGNDSILKALAGIIHGDTAGRVQAGNDYSTGVSDAEWTKLKALLGGAV